MKKRIYVTSFVVLFLLIYYSPCFSFQDASKFDIQEFSTGMTMKETKSLMKPNVNSPRSMQDFRLHPLIYTSGLIESY
jgi:hypothetical protein